METRDEQPNITKIVVAAVIGIIILGAISYAGYSYSRKKAGVTLPGGKTYLGPTPTAVAQQKQYDVFTVDPNTPWENHYGKLFPFAFSYPTTLPLVVYTGDPADTVSISWNNIPPQNNVLIDVQQVSRFDAKYINLPKEQYVKDWWKQFSGLKGLKSLTPFTNAQGLKGYRARYMDYSDQAPIDNVFFEVPNNPKLIIHLANGILDAPIYERVIHSVAWGVVTPTPAAATPTVPNAAVVTKTP